MNKLVPKGRDGEEGDDMEDGLAQEGEWREQKYGGENAWRMGGGGGKIMKRWNQSKKHCHCGAGP